MVAEKLKICRELWDAGIKAETFYHDNPNPTKQVESALYDGIPLVLFIGGDEV
jgi:histidyl-tRNA synthetase